MSAAVSLVGTPPRTLRGLPRSARMSGPALPIGPGDLRFRIVRIERRPFDARIMALPFPWELERSHLTPPHPRPAMLRDGWLESYEPPRVHPREVPPRVEDCGDYHVDAHGEPYAVVCKEGCERKIHEREQRKLRTRTGSGWQEHILQASTVLALRAMHVSQLIGDMYGTGENRDQDARRGRAARISRALPSKSEKRRIPKPLDAHGAAKALGWMESQPIRKGLERANMFAEAWFELVNPPEAIAKLVVDGDIEKRARRAWWRAEKTLTRQNRPLWVDS